MRKGLSKSRLMSYLQCPKRLWLEVHRPDLAEVSPQSESAFQIGYQVGAIAQRLYDRGHGVHIEYDSGLRKALERTTALLGDPEADPLFEATFEREGILVRLDVLQGRGSDARVVEVKAATSVKPEYVSDCAIQAWVIEASHVRPKAIVLSHINNQFVYADGGRYDGLLTEVDITADVVPVAVQVPEWTADAQLVLQDDEPTVTVGPHCKAPYECPFRSHCWPKVDYPLDDLPGLGKKLVELVACGYGDVRDVPEHLLKGADQLRVLRLTQRGKAELLPGSKAELAALAWPRYYLDFETISFPVPIWAGTRPYQQLPFQWSLHIESRPGQLDHAEFLDVSGAPPMRAAAEALLAAIGPNGPVLMYTGFERQCLKILGDFCPDLKAQLDVLALRLVDLHPIVKRNYYHPDMHGSWSIKAVLPTLAPDMDYEQLEGIQEGMAAQRAYLEAIASGTVLPRRHQLRDQLLAYCQFDTLAMVRVTEMLGK